jgi:hypothetical protein
MLECCFQVSQDQRFKYSAMLKCVDQYVVSDVSKYCRSLKAFCYFSSSINIYQFRWLEIQLAWDVMPHELVNS